MKHKVVSDIAITGIGIKGLDPWFRNSAATALTPLCNNEETEALGVFTHLINYHSVGHSWNHEYERLEK